MIKSIQQQSKRRNLSVINIILFTKNVFTAIQAICLIYNTYRLNEYWKLVYTHPSQKPE